MSKPPDPPGGSINNETSTPVPNLNLPGQLSGNPAWTGSRVTGGNPMRSFAQILEEEKKNRNILEIHLAKITTEEDPTGKSKKSLNFDDLGELIFDVLKIKIEECLTFDYNTGRYDSKQIMFKPGVCLDPYIHISPLIFKGHEITTKKQLSNITRVTFKNVPLNVPNEDIINLCLIYGKPVDNHVYYEILTNVKNKGQRGSTRYVDLEFKKGMAMENYYWLEGPLQGDQGRRVLVLHNGQTPQCSNCLRKGSNGCPAQGNGRICTEMKTPRAKMSNYMNSLKIQVFYSSLKTQFYEQQARSFPSLNETESLSSNMEALMDGFDAIIPLDPCEIKDREIASLHKELNVLKDRASETKHNILIGVYSATLDEDEIDFETDIDDSKDCRSKKDVFNSMKKQLNLDNPQQNERFKEVTNMILEKVKHTKHSRLHSRSISSQGGMKRDRSKEDFEDDRSSSRPRTSGISVKNQ